MFFKLKGKNKKKIKKVLTTNFFFLNRQQNIKP